MFKNLQLSAFKEKSFEDKEGKKHRNSLSLMFYKIFVLKNVTGFAGLHLCQSLFSWRLTTSL